MLAFVPYCGRVRVITFNIGETRFTYRVAAVCIAGGNVLLHRAASDDFWSLPGGRCEAGEAAAETVRREMHEEMDAAVTVGSLLYVVENFFTLHGQRCHELGLYFACDVPRTHPFSDRSREHVGVEDARSDALRLIFRWFPVAALMEVPFYPFCLRAALMQPTAETRHLVQRDSAENRSTARQ